jgi:hypothetical protein
MKNNNFWTNILIHNQENSSLYVINRIEIIYISDYSLIINIFLHKTNNKIDCFDILK